MLQKLDHSQSRVKNGETYQKGPKTKEELGAGPF